MTDLASLATATEALRKSNDALEANRPRSVPPSAPRQAPPVTITAERARDIAKALKLSHPMLVAAMFVRTDDGERITASEFQAFCDLCGGAK